MTSLIRTLLSNLKDIEKVKQLISNDAKFIAIRSQSYPELPIYGTFTGHDGVELFLTTLRDTFDTQQFHIDHVIETPEHGAAFGRFEHRVRATGKMFRSHWAVMCAFEDGKISLYRFFEDSAALEEALETRTICKERIS